MAVGDSYSGEVRPYSETEPAETMQEGRPMLDHSLPEPPPISELVDRLTGDASVSVGHTAFIRVVSEGGSQRDMPDGSA